MIAVKIVEGKMTILQKDYSEFNSGTTNFHKINIDSMVGWDGLTLRASFYREDVENPITISFTGTSVEVPWELLLSSGIVYFGFVGTNVEEVIVAKTNTLGVKVGEGIFDTGVVPLDPTVDIYAEIMNTAQELAGSASAALLSEQNAKSSEDASLIIKNDILIKATEVDTNKGIVLEKTDIVLAKEIIVSNKTTQVIGLAQQVSGDAVQVTGDKGVVIENANTVSLDKETVATDKLAVSQYKTTAEEKAITATEQALLSEYYANMAASIASSIPMRYYRLSEESMFAIINPVQGSVCYVTYFAEGYSDFFVYDTTDMDNDNINPEWVFLGKLEYASMDKDTLLSILQLSTVAITGSYTDLLNIPNRYESRVVLENPTWDYALGYWAVLTQTSDSTLVVNNIYNGAYGVLDVYGNFVLTLPINSYQTPPDWDYLVPSVGQHYVYSFRYDGNKFSWHRSVEYDT